ncbi:MAG TPA: flagellar biosynthetic protein FliR [Solirubrobacteraceae bacterium]|nr:flagellar biosynthetic protein FliR [Solirubrobacteraceae bacterium]
MSTSQIATLMQSISTQHVYAFFLVLARITPLFLVAPAFSSQMLIPRVRSVIAVALAFGLTPIAEHGQTLPTDVLPLAGLAIENFLVGLTLAFTISCVFASVQAAGVFADAFSGFSIGQQIDPINGNPGGTLTNLYSVVGLAIFLMIGGDAWTLRGVSATFGAVPLTHAVAPKPLTYEAEAAFASVFVGAVEIAAPLILAIIISDIAFGMVAKVMPQLNVFSVGLPMKVTVALVVVSASLPFLGTWMSNQLQSSVYDALHVLQIA